MNKVMSMLKCGQRFLAKNSSSILTGIGIAGMVTTVILAVKVTPKASEELKELKKKKAKEEDPKVTPVDVVKTTWKLYLPAAITGSLSIMCVVGASSINAKRNAALATAYTISETALNEYQKKVVETIGEKKEQEIHDKIAKDKVDRCDFSEKNIIVTEKGNTLCVDAIGGRPFRSDIDKIKRAVVDLNFRMLSEQSISLNEFYEEIGLEPTVRGDDLGWNLTNGKIELKFSSALTKDDEPCIVIDYRVMPKYDFW